MSKSHITKQIAAGKTALNNPPKRKAASNKAMVKSKGAYLSGYNLMGTMTDSTRVIQPKGSPSFSIEKLREAVRLEGLAKGR